MLVGTLVAVRSPSVLYATAVIVPFHMDITLSAATRA